MPKPRDCGASCRHFLNWFFQIGVLITLIFFIVGGISRNTDLFYGFMGPFIFFYIFYIILCFCSPTFRYLINKHKADSIHKHMENLFYTPPRFLFHVECYHYEIHHYTETDSDGRVHHRTRTEKVVSHRETEDFRFCSWRDVSGCFLLDSEKILRNQNKIYIKLELDLDFEFADDITRYDYDMQKSTFKMRNIHRDVHMDFSESIDLSGFTKYNLVRISDKRPACLNCGMFIVFTFIIPIIELYKIYINSFCVSQDYTIKKIVSTRYNLNTEEIRQKYESDLPKVIIYGEEVNYNNAPTDFNKIYDLPTEEEIEASNKFTSSTAGSKFKFSTNQSNIISINKEDYLKGQNQDNQNFRNDSLQGGAIPMIQGGSTPIINNDVQLGRSNIIQTNQGNDLEKKLLN